MEIKKWKYATIIGGDSNICFHDQMFLITDWPLGVLALDYESGKLLWEKDTQFTTEPGCVSYAKNRILLPTTNDLSLVDNRSEKIWTHKFSARNDKIFRITPTVFSNSNILCVLEDGVLACLSPQGNILWQTSAVGPPSGPPIASTNNIIYLVTDGRLIAVNGDGKIFKDFAPDIRTDISPIIDSEGNLIVALSDGGICSLAPPHLQ